MGFFPVAIYLVLGVPPPTYKQRRAYRQNKEIITQVTIYSVPALVKISSISNRTGTTFKINADCSGCFMNMIQ